MNAPIPEVIIAKKEYRNAPINPPFVAAGAQALSDDLKSVHQSLTACHGLVPISVQFPFDWKNPV